ncbi:MAG TPA: methyltransferase domain-containing protein [Steroidobacteraceae bacterium]|nr:methyltransferase domain-containing protein [Steroidobacteraceae bacterium]
MAPSRPADWLSSSLGRQLVTAESTLLRGLLDEVFGLELLQLGSWGDSCELLAGSRIRRQTVIAEQPGPCVNLVARLDALPIQTATVDAVLLPHTLEFAGDPQAVVREADRVLTGEGQVIILGFRPASLWGLRAAGSREGFPPGLQRVLGPGRVCDWLGLLGYEIVLQKKYLYCRPWDAGSPRSRRILRRGLMNPLPAAAWMIRARKHVYRMTPLRHRFFRERRRALGTLPEPTTRNTP